MNEMTFTAYFDASGTRRNEALTVAGYVSNDEKWDKFKESWARVLKREGVRCFHMTDFASKKKEYENWTGERRAQFLSDLTECAWRYTNKAIASTVVIPDYRTIDQRYCLHESLGQPYSVCGRSCVGHVKKWASKHKIQRVAFVFEQGDQDWGDFQRICREQERIEPSKYSKDEFLQFQAADLLAWKSRHPIRQSLREDHEFTVEEGQRLLDAIQALKRRPYVGGVFDVNSFLHICKHAGIPVR